MIERIRSRFDAVGIAFGRLTQREQVMVLGGGAAAAFIILLLVGMAVSGAITKAEKRVRFKTDALTEVLQLQGEYRARQVEQRQLMQRLSRTKVRLVKLVEDAARVAGIDKEIGRLQPTDGEPNADGVIESQVDLTARNLSIDRLQMFLNELEKSQGLVIINKLRINRPFRKDALDIEMSVLTYKTEST